MDENISNIISKEIDSSPKNIAELTKKHKVYFVHGIHPNFSPKDKTLLNPRVSWKRKLDVVLSLKPTLSASTIKKGENWGSLWSRMGVILSEGDVEASYSTDGATQAKSLTKRSLISIRKSTIEQGIRKTGPKGGVSGKNYNEFVVSNPSVAGFYVCLDDTRNWGLRDLVPFNEIVKKTSEKSLPLYMMLRGELYKPTEGSITASDLDNLKREIETKGEGKVINGLTDAGWVKVGFSEVAGKSINPSSEEKESMIRKILEGHTFNLKFLAEKLPFINNIVSLSQGRESFLALVKQDKLSGKADESFKYEGREGENESNQHYPTKGQEVKKIASFYTADRENNYLLWRSKLVNEITNHVNGRKYFKEVDRRQFQSGSIDFGFNTYRVGRSIYCIEDYLGGMDKEIKKHRLEIDKLQAESNTKKANWEKMVLGRLVCHVYGFGYQAGEIGDDSTKNKAFELVSKVTNIEDVRKLINQKTDNNGKIVLTEKDLS